MVDFVDEVWITWQSKVFFTRLCQLGLLVSHTCRKRRADRYLNVIFTMPVWRGNEWHWIGILGAFSQEGAVGDMESYVAIILTLLFFFPVNIFPIDIRVSWPEPLEKLGYCCSSSKTADNFLLMSWLPGGSSIGSKPSSRHSKLEQQVYAPYLGWSMAK